MNLALNLYHVEDPDIHNHTLQLYIDRKKNGESSFLQSKFRVLVVLHVFLPPACLIFGSELFLCLVYLLFHYHLEQLSLPKNIN